MMMNLWIALLLGANAFSPLSLSIASLPYSSSEIRGQIGSEHDTSIDDDTSDSNFPFTQRGPYIAVITEPDACDNASRMKDTIEAIRCASTSRMLDLVSVRLIAKSLDGSDTDKAEFEKRATDLTKEIVSISSSARKPFKVVVSSDWVNVAIAAKAHGIHVKEHHLPRIPSIRDLFPHAPVIGTSTHSIESALSSYEAHSPDYYFCGTCYMTASHPEKSAEQLEGPALPGEVASALRLAFQNTRTKEGAPAVLAIGGIDTSNCHEPVVSFGADGVATIRSVLRSKDPARTVNDMRHNMGGTKVEK